MPENMPQKSTYFYPKVPTGWSSPSLNTVQNAVTLTIVSNSDVMGY